MTFDQLKTNGILAWSGSIAWDWIGRRTANNAPKKDEMEKLEFAAPHIYGPAKDIIVHKAITHCTSSHVIIIDVNGTAYSFGRNDKGQLGDGTLVSRSDPYKIEIENETFVHAATGRGHTILVAKSGKVYGCGDNKSFQGILI
jgi:alpha-tubulin suppressor-like RCC1 family protein